MAAAKRKPGRFGTFGGVWTPSVLTILGVIMFMRSGFVVGHVGIWQALGILCFAKAITTLTTLSLSAIATNTEVGPGGNYFMISRCLGPGVGGTIGIILFLSQAVAIAFYVIGFSEALFGLLARPETKLAATFATYKIPQLASSGVIIGLFILTFKGADVALRAQYAILLVLLLSVAAFLIGGAMAFDSSVFSSNTGTYDGPGGSIGFWACFAIFFPAATGIDAGANMSGDLKDPAKSIPLGTLWAIAFTGAIYVALLVLMAGWADAGRLINDPFGELQKMSIFGPLIVAGVFAATLSSALSSFLGAPRILQSMGKDELLTPMIYFAKGHGENDEPRRATVLSLIIALCIVWAGGLNAIAEIISMFFLIAYGMINMSAFVESRAGNPSFRPRFKIMGWPAAMGATVGCAIAMVKINETYAILSLLLAGLIYLMVRGRIKSNWSDATLGYKFAKARDGLQELEGKHFDSKNWRPIVAAVTSDATRDKRMLRAASWIEGERGVLSVLEIATAPEQNAAERAQQRNNRTDALRTQLETDRISAYAYSIITSGPDAVDAVLQSHSIGAFRPNTVMLTLPPPGLAERRQWTIDALDSVAPLGLNVVLYKGARDEESMHRQIDVWWHGITNTSLMAVFTYLISIDPMWKDVRIRMLRVVSSANEQPQAEKALIELMEAARMPIEIEVILSERPVRELIVETSRSADLLVLGMAQGNVADIGSFLEQNDSMLAQLPATLLVLSNGEIDLQA